MLKNNLEDRIVFIKDDFFNVSIEEKADVIVTETIGPFALEEEIVELIRFGRDNLLKQHGKIIPESINLYIAPYNDNELSTKRDSFIDFWNKESIYGFDFSPCSSLISDNFSHNSYNCEISKEKLVSLPERIRRINFYKEDSSDFEGRISFILSKKSIIHAICGFMEVKLYKNISFDTLPSSRITHWLHSIFFWKNL